MPSSANTLQLRGIGPQAMTALIKKASLLGMTPERYVRELVQDDLALDRKAKTTTLAQIMGSGREIDETEADRLVNQARTRHRRRSMRKG